ncbi:RIP homotypic interaction motif-containing protein [Pseudonocardia lacus]|uniref:RIP homotypic interaction motif-containing protein n=1 Tax=Pseudonocardia lacus TaxID=2835865 RepID=UPI001BDC1E05|nr:RIP homotypic interaction motif-containing protein [Pseudonocardia lacus]
MDPISLILAALAAGAVAGAQGTATEVVKDAYGALRASVAARLRGRTEGEVALRAHSDAPEQWRGALEAELVRAGADRDGEVLRAAERLIGLVDPRGSAAGRYAVNVRNSQGVQIGNGNTQGNVFGTPPPWR